MLSFIWMIRVTACWYQTHCSWRDVRSSFIHPNPVSAPIDFYSMNKNTKVNERPAETILCVILVSLIYNVNVELNVMFIVLVLIVFFVIWLSLSCMTIIKAGPRDETEGLTDLSFLFQPENLQKMWLREFCQVTNSPELLLCLTGPAPSSASRMPLAHLYDITVWYWCHSRSVVGMDSLFYKELASLLLQQSQLFVGRLLFCFIFMFLFHIFRVSAGSLKVLSLVASILRP